jgi:predicted dehydrogenase
MRAKLSSARILRRAFLRQAAQASLALWAANLINFGDEPGSSGVLRKAAIIGDTGHGDYGHDHDRIFVGLPGVEVVAVADPNAEGRAKAATRSGARRQYGDYREMLEKEKPNLVCIAPRWTNQHHTMAMAALNAGAHLYLEKPFTQTLREADEILSLAMQKGRKVVVAHQIRLAPNIQFLRRRLSEGLIGELLEIRAHGKQDARAGGEDMIVLGTHLFDLIHLFAGDAEWCSARVLAKGREIEPRDIHAAGENIGPIAGDEIEARFAMAKGVDVSFTSRAAFRQTAGPWGMDLIGTKGRIRILTEIVPKIFMVK